MPMTVSPDYLTIPVDVEWKDGTSPLSSWRSFATGPLQLEEPWYALDTDRRDGSSPASRRQPGRSGWPAGKEILMRDIFLLRLLELEENRDESGATRTSLASFLQVARPRVCALSGDLEADGLVRTTRRRPGGHGRIKKVSSLTERGREIATSSRGWLLREVVEMDGTTGSVEYHLSRLSANRSVTTVLRRSKFLTDRPREDQPGEGPKE